MESLAIMFGGLVQAILLIIALVGSQRTARKYFGGCRRKGIIVSPPLFIAYLDWRTFMNTRVFKDISKVQHRAWVRIYNQTGYFCISCYRHNYFGIGLEPILLAIWGLVCLWFCFLALPFHFMLFGVYRPNDLPLKPTSSTVFIMN